MDFGIFTTDNQTKHTANEKIGIKLVVTFSQENLKSINEKKMLCPRNLCCFIIPQRWIFTILSSTGLCVGSIMKIIISITIIEMVVPTGSTEEQDNGSCRTSNYFQLPKKTFYTFDNGDEMLSKRYPWDQYTQGVILSSFFWSYAIAQCFYGSLTERFGGKHLLGFGILIQSVLTFITPFAIYWGGSTSLIIIRVLIGVANGGMYPIVSTMISHWTTPVNRTKIGTFVYAGPTLGIFIGIMASPLVLKYLGMGWPGAYYFFGIVGIIWFPFWCLYIYEDPESHPFISEEEISYFQESFKAEKMQMKPPPTPWKHMFLSKQFWIFVISMSGNNWAYFAMISNLPMYMGTVVNFSIENNGYFSALPYLLMWLNSMISTWINDQILKKQWMSLTNVRKLFFTVTTTGPSIFLILASYAECDKTLVVISFMIGITLMGNYYPSVMMNPLDLSPNYAGSIMAVGNGLAGSVGIVVPYIIGILTPNSTLGEWRLVFWIILFFSVSSNIVYLICFKADVQPWNDPDFVRSKSKADSKIKLESIS